MEERLAPAAFTVGGTNPTHATIQAALDATVGTVGTDTVTVRGGPNGRTYTGALRVPGGVTLRAEGDVTLTSGDHVVRIEGNNVEVRGFTITGSNQAGVKIGTTSDPTYRNNIRVIDNTIHGNLGSGISFRYVSNFRIEGNDIYDNCNQPGDQASADQAGGGIALEHDSHHGRVERNRIHHNINPGDGDANGIILGHGLNNVRIANNLIYENQGYGVHLQGDRHGATHHVDVVQNTLYRNGNSAFAEYGVQINLEPGAYDVNIVGNIAWAYGTAKPVQVWEAGNNVVARYNLLWDDDGGDVAGFSGGTITNASGSNNLVGAPEFYSPTGYDFRINADSNADSPARNAITGGVPAPRATGGMPGLLPDNLLAGEDFTYATERPAGGAHDIGAYERA